MNVPVLLKSYKTSLAAAVMAVIGYLLKMDYISLETFGLIMAIASAFGFASARDGDKSSKDVGADMGKAEA